MQSHDTALSCLLLSVDCGKRKHAPRTTSLVSAFSFKSAFQLSAVKPKPKQPQRPIRAKSISQGTNQLKVRTCNRSEARENASDQVAIGFSFASDCLRGWRGFSKPITERSKAKPMQSRIKFDTQLKIVLLFSLP